MLLVRKWRWKRRKKYIDKNLVLKATEVILNEQLYLDPALKCSDVAAKIGTNRTYLWSALSERGFGFQDYLSKFRIRYFIQHAGTFKDIKGHEIAEICGFNSPKSMNKYLKEMMGITLLDYMRRIEKIPCVT